MGTTKYEIFIASRFDEFKDLRNGIREKINEYSYLSAIDLNDNQASHRSPLVESLFYVRKSEIMILLIGETYGTIPEGENLSYTHLEYKEAIKDTSNTRVLVFCIGQSYSGAAIDYSIDSKMQEWQKELETNHRLKKFSNMENLDDVVNQIFIDLASSVYDLQYTESINDEPRYDDNFSIEEDGFLENQEVNFLDNKHSENEGISLINQDAKIVDGFELLKIPNKLAAIEQKEEAQYAIEINDYSTAIKHLKNALSLKPLDFESNYWLAKLYIVSAKKSLFYEIEEFLLRAARIAEKNNYLFKASHCYQLIVKASIFSDKENEGLKYINLAHDITPNFSQLFYEKAKFMLYFNHLDEAKLALIEAINIKMEAIELIEKDPFFNRYEDFIKEVFKEEKKALHGNCLAILSETNNIRKLFNFYEITIDLKNNTLTELWKKSRNAVIMQYKIVSSEIQNIDNNKLEELQLEIGSINYSYQTEREKELDSKNKKIAEAVSNMENSKKELDAEYNTNLNILTANLKDKKMYQLTKNKKYRTILIGMMSFFGLSIFSLAMLIDKQESSFFFITSISIIVMLITMYLLYYSENLNKKKLQEYNALYELNKINLFNENRKANNNLNQIIDELINEYLENYEAKIHELDIQCKNNLDNVYKKILQLQSLYEKITVAFESFEKKAITLSKSKFIPFKSFKNTSVGSIIRVTPSSYKHYTQAGGEVILFEDFPEHLNILKIDALKSSFLAKVVKKYRNHIELSRFEAYNDTNIFTSNAK
jgi:hypothetical protein